MKRLLSTSLLSCTVFLVFGQLSLSPDFVEVPEIDENEWETVVYCTVTSEFDMAVEVTWIRDEIAVTESWGTAVCDVNLCHLSHVSTQSFFLPPLGDGNIDIHVYPYGNEGSAVVEIALVADAAPEDTVSGMYYFNTSLGTTEVLSEKIRIYPNPAKDFLQIESGHEVHTLEIYSLEGRVVLQAQMIGAQVLNIGHLNPAAYIVRMRDREGGLLSSNVWIKQ